MSTAHPSLNKPTVLVIDDEPGICLVLSYLLRDDFVVITADSLAEGLGKLTPDVRLILLDLRMPGVHEYDHLEHLREVAPRVPIAILSAYVDQQVQQEVIRRGAVALLEKPFSRQELFSHISRILRDAVGQE